MKRKNPLISVIIPTRNSARTLAECLRSVDKQSYTNVELIVVDNNSTDETLQIAQKYADVVITAGPERSAQRNRGAEAAKGEYFLFIDSDMVLTKKVLQECVDEMAQNIQARGLVIPEVSVGTGLWSRAKALERSFYIGVPWMEAARFFTAEAFHALGGYDELNTGTEDYDLPQRAVAKWGSDCISRIKARILHDEGNLKYWGTISKKFYYAQRLNRYKSVSENRSFFRLQSSPFQRYKLYFKNLRVLFADPFLGLCMLFLKTSEYAAGFIGFMYSQTVNISQTNFQKKKGRHDSTY